jgi:NAD(P)-dependent dehydrogenase (short-subunit alcohol dehydrogenase family)
MSTTASTRTFTHQVALVTGGTSGIGRETALEFARQGARVAVTGRRAAEGAETIRQLRALGAEAIFIQGDITQEADVKRMVDETVRTFGRLDMAFNNAGVELFEPVTSATAESYHRVFDANVLGVLLSLKHQVPALLASGGGAIVNTSSIAGEIGFQGAAIYTASKHAVNGLTRTAALEFAKQGVRVNAVAPGAVQTEMLDRAFGAGENDQKKFMATLHPIGRIGTSPEVAKAVVFLASPAASFITGQILAVDGGFVAA